MLWGSATSDYAQAGKLRNPVNDADAMEHSLKNLGFETDTKVQLGSLATIREAFTEFQRHLYDSFPG